MLAMAVPRAIILLFLAAAAQPGEPDRALLEACGIGRDPGSLGAYLGALRPG